MSSGTRVIPIPKLAIGRGAAAAAGGGAADGGAAGGGPAAGAGGGPPKESGMVSRMKFSHLL